MNVSFCMFVVCTLDVERFRGSVAQCRAFGKPFSMARMSTSCSRAVVKHSSLDACLVLFRRGFDSQCSSRLKGCSFAVDMQVCVQICVLSVLGHPHLDLVPPQKTDVSLWSSQFLHVVQSSAPCHWCSKFIGCGSLRPTLPCDMSGYTAEHKNRRILALFDVDGTLTEPRKVVSPETLDYLQALRTKICTGVVGGSDLVKQKEQLGDSPALFDYAFSENGLLAFKDGHKIGETSIVQHLGEEKLKKLINWVLRYFSDLDIPVKRGTFIEFRQGMLNLSPIGRNCSRKNETSLRNLI